jgi:hypothetical protein
MTPEAGTLSLRQDQFLSPDYSAHAMRIEPERAQSLAALMSPPVNPDPIGSAQLASARRDTLKIWADLPMPTVPTMISHAERAIGDQ